MSQSRNRVTFAQLCAVVGKRGKTVIAGRTLPVCLGVLLLTAPGADAATFYVSPAGNDANSCNSAQSTSPSSHKLTISAGVACLSPGDTLMIRGGTYTGSRNVIDSQTYPVPAGSSWSNPVTISGYPGETVVIQPPNNVSAVRLRGNTSYVVIQDLVLDLVNSVDGTDADVVLLWETHHVRLQRIEAKNGKSFGIGVGKDTPFIEVLDSRIHDIGATNGDHTNGHCLYISGSDGLYEGNELFNCIGYGYHVYNYNTAEIHTDPSRNVIRRNRIHNNGVAGGYGIVLAWGDGNVAYNNLIYDNYAGILIYIGALNAQVYNNTIVGNRGEGIGMQYYGNAPSIRNNIVFGNGAAIANNGGTGSPIVDHNLTTEPGFTDGGRRDFTLRGDSAARDVGISLSVVTDDFARLRRPSGGGYDIGAFEYSGSTQTSSLPPPPPQNVRLIIN
jgi:parallel beta helix pectate lyase-like protein